VLKTDNKSGTSIHSAFSDNGLDFFNEYVKDALSLEENPLVGADMCQMASKQWKILD